MGTLIVLGIRAVVPLTVFRWPLAGAAVTVAADAVDILVFQLAGFPPWDYHALDKVLDTYALSLQFVVAQRWAAAPRAVASALFAGRIVGVVLFESTGQRALLLAFPNLFEPFFLLVAAMHQVAPGEQLAPRTLALWLAVLLVPKLAQEYILHEARLLDDLVAVEIIRDAAGAILPGLRRLSPFA